MIAVFAPGQGAQSPGMLAPWLELPGVPERVARWSELTGLDLERLGTTAEADEITDTANTQPLLVMLGLLSAHEIDLDAAERVVAGHSVGELTAAAVAGALSPEDAVAFAARRGAAMAAACALEPTGMVALLGGDEAAVLAAIEAAGLTPANRNGAGQIVAAGAQDALDRLASERPGGARVRALRVAGAFHTAYMRPAEDTLLAYASGVPFADPRPIVLSNADGACVTEAGDLRDRLVRQVTVAVRWDLCLQSCRDIGVTAVVELAPGGVLAGIAKRELPGVEIVAVRTPEDLDAARALIASRPQHGQGEHTPDIRVIVTPMKGVFSRDGTLAEGAEIVRGTRVGTVRTNRDEQPVIATSAGVLTEWLRHDGDIVAAGLPVARLSTGAET